MGKRGPAATPSNVRQLRGETRPSRINNAEPQPPAARPEPPEYLDLDALGVWQRLAPTLIARNVLTVWDVDAFAAYCTAVVHHRRAARIVNEANVVTGTGRLTAKHPALQVVRDQAQLIVTLGGRFGLNPSDRAGIKLEEAEGDGSSILD